MKFDAPRILLVNPWIHDFAAHDFWARPLGLLYLAAILRMHGLAVSYIDCLDRFHPRHERGRSPDGRRNPHPTGNNDGRGPYLKTPIPKPAGLEKIPRNYSRYGIKPEWLLEDLSEIDPPDLVMVTSVMTYWYGGVRETIEHVRKVFPGVPVVAGGIYATLCPVHAEATLGADRVETGPGEEKVLRLVSEFTGFSPSLKFDPSDLSTYPYPALDLQRKIPFAPLATSRGCPFACAYCAGKILQPNFVKRPPEQVVDEIEHWRRKFGVVNFAFYDDALLMDAENHASIIFEGIVKRKIDARFHTPNALHIREITKKQAALMRRAGFETIRLGLETADFKHRKDLDRKVTEEQFRIAVANLLEAGFERKQIGAYLLTGLPDQTTESVEASIEVVKKAGITPVPAHYTPIPGTRLWKKAVESSRFDLESDPVFTNNAVFPCQREEFSRETPSRLKRLATEPERRSLE